MENIGVFALFSLSLGFAGGTPALPVVSRFPVRFSSAARLGRRTLKKLSNVVQVVSFPSSFVRFVVFAAEIPPGGARIIFSNRWKMGEKFFQSLEKMGGFFQPLENYFPIIGKSAFGR